MKNLTRAVFALTDIIPFEMARQEYPREPGKLIAAHSLFPPQTPPLTEAQLSAAIEAAFSDMLRTSTGELREIPNTPEQWVDISIQHLKERGGPDIAPYFYSLCDLEDIFFLDAIPYDIQCRRMELGLFYQYLIKHLMRLASSNVEVVNDGMREADLVADVKTPGFPKGLKLYISVKRSPDTVGGQDVPGTIVRLENEMLEDKNRRRPYLGAFAYAIPSDGQLKPYDKSRKVKCNREKKPHSENVEAWQPGFVFPYITGHPPTTIYSLVLKHIDKYLRFYTLEHKEACMQLLKKRLSALGLVGGNGKIDRLKFLEFIITNPPAPTREAVIEEETSRE